MRDLNTVGLKSVAESKRGTMMGNPRPGYGRVVSGIYEPQGSSGYGRFRPQMGSFKYPNFRGRNRVGCTYSYRGVHRAGVWVKIIASLRLMVLSESGR